MELGDYIRAEKVDGESREQRDGVYLGDEGPRHVILRSDLGRDYTCYKSGARVIPLDRCSTERRAFIKSVQRKMHARVASA